MDLVRLFYITVSSDLVTQTQDHTGHSRPSIQTRARLISSENQGMPWVSNARQSPRTSKPQARRLDPHPCSAVLHVLSPMFGGNSRPRHRPNGRCLVAPPWACTCLEPRMVHSYAAEQKARGRVRRRPVPRPVRPIPRAVPPVLRAVPHPVPRAIPRPRPRRRPTHEPPLAPFTPLACSAHPGALAHP